MLKHTQTDGEPQGQKLLLEVMVVTLRQVVCSNCPFPCCFLMTGIAALRLNSVARLVSCLGVENLRVVSCCSWKLVPGV